MVYLLVFSVVDKIGWYINRFCLSWTILVGKSPCFVCREQYWLLYIPGLCVMNKTGWYISRFCPLLTIMVGISPSFFCSGQNWLVYQPVLSVVDKNSCISTVFVGRGQYWAVYFMDVSCLDNIGW